MINVDCRSANPLIKEDKLTTNPLVEFMLRGWEMCSTVSAGEVALVPAAGCGALAASTASLATLPTILGYMASLARALLGTRSYYIVATSNTTSSSSLLVTKGIATRSKDATSSSWHRY